MLIFRINMLIDESLEGTFRNWFLKTYLPDIINTGHFKDYTFTFRTSDGPTASRNYEFDCIAKNKEELGAFKTNHAEKVLKQFTDNYSGEFNSISVSEYEDLTESLLEKSFGENFGGQ